MAREEPYDGITSDYQGINAGGSSGDDAPRGSRYGRPRPVNAFAPGRDYGTSRYGNPIFRVVTPTLMRYAAEGAKDGVHDLRVVTRFRGFGLGGGGGGGGSGGGDGGIGNSGVDSYYRRITSTAPAMIGPPPAPTAFQSIRGGVNGMGIRGGLAVASIGVNALAEEAGNISAENDAANAGDAGGYLAAQEREYGGITGAARYGVHTLYHKIGLTSEGPGQQMEELAQAAKQEAEVEQRVKVAQKGAAGHEQLAKAEEEQGERVKEAQAADGSTREALRSEFKEKRTDDQATAIVDHWREYTADQSSRGFQKIKAETDRMKEGAAAERKAEDDQRAKETASHVGAMESEAQADRLETAGDETGARRVRLEERLKRESEEAHSRSGAEGQAFDRDVAPAERAKLAAAENRQRVDDERDTTDKITDLDERAKVAQLEATGNTGAAQREAKFAEIDREAERYQREADRENYHGTGELAPATGSPLANVPTSGSAAPSSTPGEPTAGPAPAPATASPSSIAPGTPTAIGQVGTLTVARVDTLHVEGFGAAAPQGSPAGPGTAAAAPATPRMVTEANRESEGPTAASGPLASITSGGTGPAGAATTGEMPATGVELQPAQGAQAKAGGTNAPTPAPADPAAAARIQSQVDRIRRSTLERVPLAELQAEGRELNRLEAEARGPAPVAPPPPRQTRLYTPGEPIPPGTFVNADGSPAAAPGQAAPAGTPPAAAPSYVSPHGAQLQRVADAAKRDADAEKRAYDEGRAREDRERAQETRGGTAVEALKAAGMGAEADEYRQLMRDATEARQADREGRPEDASALRERAKYDKEQGDYRRDQEEHGRATRERQAAYRANGQGAMAEYDQFREREADDIREAERSGDPARIAQAKRTAADDLKGYQREHQERAAVFGQDDYQNKLLTGDMNSNGTADALASVTKDRKTLDAGGDLQSSDAAGARLEQGAKAFGDVVQMFRELLENSPQILSVGR